MAKSYNPGGGGGPNTFLSKRIWLLFNHGKNCIIQMKSALMPSKFVAVQCLVFGHANFAITLV